MVQAESDAKLFSPDKAYSVEIMRGYGLNSSALVLFRGTKEFARIPAEDRYLFEGTIDPLDLKIREWKVSKAK